MANIKIILARLLRLAGESDDYFVSGSLSFLPLLGNYRQPEHDVDAAIADHLFHSRKNLLEPNESFRLLHLSEVAIARDFRLAKVFSPKTGFIHINGPGGLLDISCYRRGRNRFIFSLGSRLTLEVPNAITDRFRLLNWEGMTYQAGPAELAFVPKAVSYLRAKSRSDVQEGIGLKHIDDLRQLMKIIDWNFVEALLEEGGIYWSGHRPPKSIRSKIDPLSAKGIMELRHDEALLSAIM